MESSKVERIQRQFKPRGINPDKVMIVCSECGAEKERYVSQTFHKRTKEPLTKHYCSKLCQTLGLRKHRNKRERERYWVQKQKEKYHTDPEWRARLLVKHQKSAASYRNKPENKEREKETHRARIERIKADPVLYEQYLARLRANGERYRRRHGKPKRRPLTDEERKASKAARNRKYREKQRQV